jgi:alpha-L-fucosidase
VDIYYHSIGRNASFLLNFPVDMRGLIHENDVEHLMNMVDVIRRDMETDLARDMDIRASQVRGGSRKFSAEKAVDGDPETYWATDDDVLNASLIIEFGKKITFNRFLAQEYIPLGQRVKKFSIEAWINDAWEEIDAQTTIGAKRILRFENVSSERLRFNILESKACPTISNIEVYHAPKLMEAPAIERDKNGVISMKAFDGGLDIYYTTDGSDPGTESNLYTESIEIMEKGQVKAMVHDPESGESSEPNILEFDICKEMWEVIKPDPRKDYKGAAMVDSNVRTIWRSDKEGSVPVEVVVDLGEKLELAGFTYLPTQQRYIDGTISHYSFYVSPDGKRWGEAVSEGEFSNIRNSPILQSLSFDPIEARYIRFVAEREINDLGFVNIAELGVITAD